jgi:hypothetical protein
MESGYWKCTAKGHDTAHPHTTTLTYYQSYESGLNFYSTLYCDGEFIADTASMDISQQYGQNVYHMEVSGPIGCAQPEVRCTYNNETCVITYTDGTEIDLSQTSVFNALYSDNNMYYYSPCKPLSSQYRGCAGAYGCQETASGRWIPLSQEYEYCKITSPGDTQLRYKNFGNENLSPTFVCEDWHSISVASITGVEEHNNQKTYEMQISGALGCPTPTPTTASPTTTEPQTSEQPTSQTTGNATSV